LAAVAVLVATPLAGASGHRFVSDNVFRVPLLRGWSGSVAFGGGPPGPPPAWMEVGNFFFPSNYASTHEGAPSVPPRRVLISFLDFQAVGVSLHWQRVTRLRLPQQTSVKRLVSWRVRFNGRALVLYVRFGSVPDAHTRALANAVLASVTPV